MPAQDYELKVKFRDALKEAIDAPRNPHVRDRLSDAHNEFIAAQAWRTLKTAPLWIMGISASSALVLCSDNQVVQSVKTITQCILISMERDLRNGYEPIRPAAPKAAPSPIKQYKD